MTKTQSAIEAALKAIGNELAKLVTAVAEETRDEFRTEALESVGRMFGAAHANGVRPKTKGKPANGFTPTKGSGKKRSSADLTAQAAKLLTYINSHPGERAEKIAGALGVKTKELPVPIKILLAEKKIRASGVARGTTYTAVG